jgi:hypothetical protein
MVQAQALEGEIAGLSYADILALEGLLDDSPVTVYLSGSLISGIGNAWSDVDVFVIGDREPVGPYARSTATNDVSIHYTKNKRVDFEYWRPAYVRELAERLARFKIGSGAEVAGSTFILIEECFIDRLKYGVPLLNPDRFAAWQAQFDFAHYRAYHVEQAMKHLDGVLEDLCGMKESGDLDVALFSAREVVGVAVDAYCHKLGNTDPTRKWRAKYLQRYDDGSARHREVSETFWRLQFPDVEPLRANPEACRDYLERCIRFANRVASWVQS